MSHTLKWTHFNNRLYGFYSIAEAWRYLINTLGQGKTHLGFLSFENERLTELASPAAVGS
jgi:hypothetical protein